MAFMLENMPIPIGPVTVDMTNDLLHLSRW